IYSDPVPSPAFSRAYLENRFDGANYTSDIRMFNLASPAVAHHQVPGWPAGWWDETHLLLKSASGGISLYNLTTRQVRPLLSSRDLKAWLEQHQIRADIRHIAPFPVETEQRSRFYLTD